MLHYFFFDTFLDDAGNGPTQQAILYTLKGEIECQIGLVAFIENGIEGLCLFTVGL